MLTFSARGSSTFSNQIWKTSTSVTNGGGPEAHITTAVVLISRAFEHQMRWRFSSLSAVLVQFFHHFSSRRYGNVNGSLTRYIDYAFGGEWGHRGCAMPIHFAAALCVQYKIVRVIWRNQDYVKLFKRLNTELKHFAQKAFNPACARHLFLLPIVSHPSDICFFQWLVLNEWTQPCTSHIIVILSTF